MYTFQLYTFYATYINIKPSNLHQSGYVNNYKEPFIQAKIIRYIIDTWEGIYILLPNQHYPDYKKSVINIDGYNYSMIDNDSFLTKLQQKRFKYANKQMEKYFTFLKKNYIHKYINIYCIYATHESNKTMAYFNYDNKRISYTQGDGSVPLQSLNRCNLYTKNIKHFKFDDSKDLHRYIFQLESVNRYILNILK
ncbi:hypothetical protein A3Q56_07129 [Intoshia linei]|uniref:Uncharacterized protein n=1 Tax=Intoshia linei TaxID=1819745 RepID=A0A177ASZ1_9BILA|nr:hypothetical protein A3Q56_07129 [Intoshia linei]